MRKARAGAQALGAEGTRCSRCPQGWRRRTAMAGCRLLSARRGPARCRAAAARGFSAWATRHYSRLSTPMRSWSPVRTCAGRLRRPSFLRSSRIASVTDRPCALRCNGCEPSDACMSFRTLLRSGRPMAGLDLWRCMPPQRRLSRRRHLQRAQRGDVRRSSRGCRRRKGSGIGKGWRKSYSDATMMTLRDM